MTEVQTTTPSRVAPLGCPNCAAVFGQPVPRYCPDCGQETRLRPPTLIEFAKQFGGSYVAMEGALWRTLALLLLRPGRLTLEYLQGRRRRYVLPLRLFLTISVLVLLLVRVLATNQLDPSDAQALNVDKPSNVGISLGPAKAGLRDGAFYCDGLPATICKRLKARVALDTAGLQREALQLSERFVGNLGGAMFVLLPSFALWLKLVYFNRRLRYTEHLVFALHVHAFWFLMLGLALADLPWLTPIVLLAVPVYTWLAMAAVYGGRRFARLLRAGVVSLLYGLSLAFAAAGVGVWSLLF